MSEIATHHTRALIDTANLAHNLRLLQGRAGGRPMWPAIKANAYGHGADIIARKLVELGCRTLCVAHVDEAIALREAGIAATFVVLSPALAEDAAAFVEHGLEAAVCSRGCVEALATAGRRAGRCVSLHVIVDTGMGRVGVKPEEVVAFVAACRALDGVVVKGIMSHFPRADEADRSYSLAQIARFRQVWTDTRDAEIVYHMANSAGVLALPDSLFDAVRPGIAIYGLNPFRPGVDDPLAAQLRPVLELRTRITFLKEVPAGTGLSYGHSFHAERASLIATVPIGYGDGLRRGLSNRMEMLVHGTRCRQVGTITMDQSLLDVTALRGRVREGDEVVVIGSDGAQTLGADELAATLGTINYEVVTAIAERVPRIECGTADA